MNAKIITPALTILKGNGSIDYEGNKKLIEHLIKNGVDGILVLGSSGEFNKFSTEEKRDYLDFYLKEVDGRVEVLAGTGCINYDDTVELSNYALKNGADGVLLISELYFNMSQDDLFHYYNELCKAIEGKVYIYNYPANTGNNIDVETLLKLLRENKNLAGIKDTVGEFEHTKELLDKILDEFPDFKIYSGFDDQFVMNVKKGGAGNISALSNIAPDLWSSWVKAYNESDEESFKIITEKINGLMELYSLDSNLFNIFKNMLRYTGLDVSTKTLFPFDNLAQEQIEKGKVIMDKYYL